MTFVIGSLVLLGATSVYGLWFARSSQELMEQSQTIFVGNITAIKTVQVEEFTKYEMEENGILKTIMENYALTLEDYDVKIEEFLKNPQNFDTIKVRQPTISGAPSRLSVMDGFEVGDRVLFYLDKIDGENMYSPESFKIPKECDSKAFVFSSTPFSSPYEIKQGNLVNPEEFISGINIHFSYPTGYNTLESTDHDFEVKITKIDSKSKEPAFEKTFQIHKKTCEWTNTVEWDFIPESGEYLVQISNSYDQSTTTNIITVIPIKDPDKIELIDGKPFFVSREYKITRNPDDVISFHGVKFTHPAFPDPPPPGGGAFTEITFQDGAKETLSQVGLLKNPALLTTHTYPQAGIMENQYDTFSLLVSADLTKIFPLKQFKFGITPDKIRCREGLEMILKSSNGNPACVKPGNKSKLLERGWAVDSYESYRMLPKIITDTNDTGVITWKNQTYYFETPHYAGDVDRRQMQISFHDVVFTLFPQPFNGGLPPAGCGGKYYWADATFADGINELLQILVNSKSKSCNDNSIPIILSNHTNPQAGLTFIGGSFRLLVSSDSDNHMDTNTKSDWKKEIQEAREFVVAREKKLSNELEEFRVPDQFSTGHKLVHIGTDGIRTNLAEYFNHDSSIMLFYSYCNCTKSAEILADEELSVRSGTGQILNVDNISVAAYPRAVIDYMDHVYDKYVFVLYYDGYRISLHTDENLDDGLALVEELLDFEKNVKMTE